MDGANLFLFVGYNSLFTVASVAMVVVFFLKRKSFLLKERIPSIVIPAQISAIIVQATMFLSYAFEPGSAVARCMIDLTLASFLSNVLFLIFGLRISLLYRRFFIGSLFKEQRRLLRTQSVAANMNRNETEDNAVEDPGASPSTWRYRLAKYGVRAYYSFLLVWCIWAHVMMYLENGPERSAETNSSPFIGAFIFVTCLLALVLGWKMRNFHDNFKIGLEFRRYARFTVLFGIAIIGNLLLTSELHIQLTVFIYHCNLVLSGFVPLYEQWRLERQIESQSFVAHDKFESLLVDQQPQPQNDPSTTDDCACDALPQTPDDSGDRNSPFSND